jgi:hypothetical protein
MWPLALLWSSIGPRTGGLVVFRFEAADGSIGARAVALCQPVCCYWASRAPWKSKTEKVMGTQRARNPDLRLGCTRPTTSDQLLCESGRR